MRVCITAPGAYVALDSDIPVIGQVYTLEDAATGTEAQNNAFHALVQEYWRLNQDSYEAKTFDDFRNQIKRKLGAGFEAYVYAVIEDGRPVIRDAKKYEDIPEAIRVDPHYKQLIRGRLKSWSDYTKKQRRETMDRLISEMHRVGINSKKFEEILEGMGSLWGN